MLKRILMTVLLSLAVSAVYANAPVMIFVTGDMIDQPFNIGQTQWGYQFNNATGKTLTFTLTVAKKSVGSVELECIHKDMTTDENTIVLPGASQTCVTDDDIRIVTANDENLPASGLYTLKVGSK